MSGLFGRRLGRENSIDAAGLLVMAALLVSGCGGCNNTEAKPQGKEPAPARNATEILKRVVKAYHSADSYQDAGRLHVQYACNGNVIKQDFDFSLALSGPNQLRMRAYDALAVCDGRTFYATIDEAPGEVLSYAAPEELAPLLVYKDLVLGKALNKIVGSVPLSFFLDPNPMAALVFNAAAPQLDPSEKIGSDLCYRVRVDRREGPMVLWIDEQTFVVRRAEYPPGGYRRLLEPYVGPITDMTITAEIAEARLNPQIDDALFHFEVPKGAELVKQFEGVRPGAIIPKFKFRSLDGRTITRDSLADKIAVIKFWQLEDLRLYPDDMAAFEQVRKRYQDNDSIVFLTVNTDADDASDDELQAIFTKVGWSLPIARASLEAAQRSFGLQIVWTTVILGRNSTLQEHVSGLYPNQLAAMPKSLETLLAGGELVLEAPEEAPNYLFYSGFSFQNADASEEEQRAASDIGKIGPRSEPDLLRRTRLWNCSELKQPGNMVVVHDGSGSDRVFVIDGVRSVAEIGADGKVAARHELDLPNRKDSAVTFLRTATDGAGNRYFLGSQPAVQQVHLFDADWKRLRSFPQFDQPESADATANGNEKPPKSRPESTDHPGIADALLADMDGDGELEMIVGYLRWVGVHCVTLDGERLWRNPVAETVLRLDVTEPDRRRQRQLLVAQGVVLPIDAQGNERPPITVPEALLRLIYTADLDGDGNSEWCAIAGKLAGPNKPFYDEALGLSPRGEVLWSYGLPAGIQPHLTLEMISSGNLLGGELGQWVIAAADGSIHIVGFDGTLIDHFNYGAAASGMAVAQLDGQPALIVATDNTVEAWHFEMPRQEKAREPETE